MKRKPLKYIEQKRLVHFHRHQKRFGEMLSHRHFVSLPDPAPQADTKAGAGPSGADVQANTPTTTPSKLPVAQPVSQDAMRRPPNDMVGTHPKVSATIQINPNRPKFTTPMPQLPQTLPPLHQENQRVNETLQMIKRQNQARLRPTYNPMAQPVYSRHPMTQMTMHPQPAPMGSYNPNLSALQQQQQQLRMKLLQMPPDQRQMYLQRYRAQQQARQMQMMSSQYPPQYQQMGHPHMGQPMQATPPMPMQSMQHSYGPQQMMVRTQYPQHPPPTMNMQQRPY